MRRGMLMLLLLLACACIAAYVGYVTGLFPAIFVAVAACSSVGLLISWFRPSEPALFLIAQPCIFLSWEIAPLLAFILEAALILALLFSLDLLTGGRGLAYPALFLILLGVITLFLSGTVHVLVPLAAFIIVLALAWLLVMGLAYRTVSRAGRDMR